MVVGTLVPLKLFPDAFMAGRVELVSGGKIETARSVQFYSHRLVLARRNEGLGLFVQFERFEGVQEPLVSRGLGGLQIIQHKQESGPYEEHMPLKSFQAATGRRRMPSAWTDSSRIR